MTAVQQLAMYNTACISTGPKRALCTGTPETPPTSRRRNVPVRTGCRISQFSRRPGRSTHRDTHTQCSTLTPVPSCSPLNLIWLNEFTKTAVNRILSTYTYWLSVCQQVTMTDFDQTSNSEFTPNFGRSFWFRCTLIHCNGSLCLKTAMYFWFLPQIMSQIHTRPFYHSKATEVPCAEAFFRRL